MPASGVNLETPRDERFEATPCLLCDEDRGLTPFLEQDATVVGIGYRHALVRCERCAFVFVRPRLRPAVFSDYYRDYYKTTIERYANERKTADLAVAARILARLGAHGLRPGARLLEVGCGGGNFLEAAQAAGFRASGIEPSTDAVRFVRARGLDATEGSLDTAPLGEASFDAIALVQTLEHLPAPRKALERVRSLLVPGGLVAIEVPNVENAFTTWSRRLGRADGTRTLEPGDHYSYFSARSLGVALERAGLAVVEVDAGWNAAILRGRVGPLASPLAVVSRALRWGTSVLGIGRRTP
ncbi:class I SAM-dependent methyltransferase [bacterium]|nr:class I SAM-dependent methyltransferase [bacterium]